MNNKTEKLLNQAAQQTQRSNGKYKLGAIVVNRKIVGKGYNTNRNHPEIHHQSALCAEEKAILDTPSGLLKGATVYVARLNRRGQWRLARPCEDCQTLLQLSNISKVVYSIAENEYGTLKFVSGKIVESK